jgi:AcrR family transcriptional regulator
MGMPTRNRSNAPWLRAAARRLAQGGVGALAIESLARDLDVTKGSFYWHFRDRAALLSALLASWEARATAPLLDRLRDVAGGPAARLAGLAATVATEGGGSLDPAMRGWALHDAAAAAVVARVDVARMAFIAREFQALGFDPDSARTRARLLYLYLLGEHALALAARPAEERLSEARRVLDLLTRGRAS